MPPLPGTLGKLVAAIEDWSLPAASRRTGASSCPPKIYSHLRERGSWTSSSGALIGRRWPRQGSLGSVRDPDPDQDPANRRRHRQRHIGPKPPGPEMPICNALFRSFVLPVRRPGSRRSAKSPPRSAMGWEAEGLFQAFRDESGRELFGLSPLPSFMAFDRSLHPWPSRG